MIALGIAEAGLGARGSALSRLDSSFDGRTLEEMLQIFAGVESCHAIFPAKRGHDYRRLARRTLHLQIIVSLAQRPEGGDSDGHVAFRGDVAATVKRPVACFRLIALLGVFAGHFLETVLRAVKELRNCLTALIVLEDVFFFSLRGKMSVLRLEWYLNARGSSWATQVRVAHVLQLSRGLSYPTLWLAGCHR